MQTGLICFEAVAKINQVDVDLRSIIREYGIGEQEVTKEELIRISKQAGFMVKIKNIPIEKTSNYPIPAIFILKDNSFGLLLKPNYPDKKMLIFIPTEKNTRDISFDQFN